MDPAPICDASVVARMAATTDGSLTSMSVLEGATPGMVGDPIMGAVAVPVPSDIPLARARASAISLRSMSSMRSKSGNSSGSSRTFAFPLVLSIACELDLGGVLRRRFFLKSDVVVMVLVLVVMEDGVAICVVNCPVLWRDEGVTKPDTDTVPMSRMHASASLSLGVTAFIIIS